MVHCCTVVKAAGQEAVLTIHHSWEQPRGVVQVFIPSYNGDWGRRTAWVQELQDVVCYKDQVSAVSLASILWPPRAGGPSDCQKKRGWGGVGRLNQPTQVGNRGTVKSRDLWINTQHACLQLNFSTLQQFRMPHLGNFATPRGDVFSPKLA